MDIATRQTILDQIIAACEGAQYANRDAWFAKATLVTLREESPQDVSAMRTASDLCHKAADEAARCAIIASDLFAQIPDRAGTEAAYALTGRSYEWKCAAVQEAARAEQHARAAEDLLAQAERGEESTTTP